MIVASGTESAVRAIIAGLAARQRSATGFALSRRYHICALTTAYASPELALAAPLILLGTGQAGIASRQVEPHITGGAKGAVQALSTVIVAGLAGDRVKVEPLRAGEAVRTVYAAGGAGRVAEGAESS